MTLSINEILPNNQRELYQRIMDLVSTNLRVACPGIIQSFNPTEQVVTVQPAIRERVMNPKTKVYSWVSLPLLVDVPIVVPRAGGFSLTLPIKKGDECLIIFADRCIDAWWESGGVQDQAETRRHDLSDAFAVLGTWSQPRVLSNYSTTAAQLRTDDGNTYISLKPGEIDLVASTVKANGTVIG